MVLWTGTVSCYVVGRVWLKHLGWRKRNKLLTIGIDDTNHFLKSVYITGVLFLSSHKTFSSSDANDRWVLIFNYILCSVEVNKNEFVYVSDSVRRESC